MIISTVGRELLADRQTYLICLGAAVDEATFLSRGKVKQGTYAGELLSKLHDAIFRQSLRLDRDYRKYYAVEYSTFAEYLRKRFLLPEGLAAAASTRFEERDQIIYFIPRYWFLEGDYGLEFLAKLLDPTEEQ